MLINKSFFFILFLPTICKILTFVRTFLLFYKKKCVGKRLSKYKVLENELISSKLVE